jgi:hypothetical protein
MQILALDGPPTRLRTKTAAPAPVRRRQRLRIVTIWPSVTQVTTAITCVQSYAPVGDQPEAPYD